VKEGLVACVIDNDMIAAVSSGKKAGRAFSDLFVVRTLRRLYPNVKLVAAVERESQTIDELVRLKPGIVFNLAFSALPSEAAFVGALEILGIPYTGSGPLGIALANDKVRSRRLLAAAGIRVPQFVELSPTHRPAKIDFPPPYFVKPAISGNSVGIHAKSMADSYARALKQADRIWRELEQPSVCDEFIVGREFHVSLIERKRGVFKTAGIVELHFARTEPGKGFSTQVNIVKGKDRRTYKVRHRRATLTRRQLTELSEIAATAANLLQLRGYAKVDMRMDQEGRIAVIEVNANPALWNGEIWRRPSFETNLKWVMEAALRKALE